MVNQNQSASFVCVASGIPVPNITWVKAVDNSTVLSSSDVINITEEIVSVNHRVSVLTFLNTVVTDESVYWCEGTNDVPNVIDYPMHKGSLAYP